MKTRHTRSRLTAAILAAAALVLTGCTASGGVDAAGNDRATLMLDVALLPKHAPFFAAVEQGFFEAEGIALEVQPGSGSGNTVTAVETGRVTFGFADFGVTILNQGKGAAVKQVNLLQGVSAYSVITLPESGITSWEDLKGKRVATEGSGAMTAMWPAAVELAGIQETDVEIVHAAGEAKIPGLVAGKWDANLALFMSDEPILAGMGYDPVVLKWSDIGIQLYGNGIVASDETIAERPDLVERFNRAMLKGFTWACANPAAAAADFNAEVQGFGTDTVVRAIDAQCSLNWNEENTASGFGTMSDEGVQQFIDVAADYLGLEDPSAITPADVYTNEFLTTVSPGDTFESPAGA